MSLPANVKAQIQASSRKYHVIHMQQAKINVREQSSMTRTIANRQLDEPGPEEARAMDKVFRLPPKK